MNLIQLLQMLHPDLAEWERQRRLRAMGSPTDRFTDGPQLNHGGVFYDAIPRNPLTGHGEVTYPGLGHLLMPGMIDEPIPFDAPLKKKEKRT